MSKIICDVCGTSYPETATQCPICGCVRPVDIATVAGDTNESDVRTTGTYTYVKGGRFSKANVKKRNRAVQTAAAEPAAVSEEPEQEKTKSDKGLIITVCALLVAIIAVVIYIALHFFMPSLPQGDNSTAGNAASTTDNTQQTTTEATVLEVPCVDIVISKTLVELDKEGAAYLLNVTTDPGNTTDEVIFTSGDETVATVSDGGKIVAVGPGETVITVTCGSATAECRVVCNIEVEETTEATEAPTVSDEDFKLNRDDFTLSKKGATWQLYNGDIPVKQITWTSDDEKVVTIKDGVVTAVGSGTTTVHAEYNGTKRSCTVRCSAAVGKYEEQTDSSEPENTGTYNISTTDVTIDVGEVFTLKLLDADNIPVDVVWSVTDPAICSVSGNSITGVASGTTTVTVMYEGTQYTCTVRVR